MHCGRRGGGEIVEREVAIGDGVDRVRRRRREPELACHELAVDIEIDAGERACPERHHRASLGHGPEAGAIAQEHPHVSEQVMAEIDGLRALEVRIPR